MLRRLGTLCVVLFVTIEGDIELTEPCLGIRELDALIGSKAAIFDDVELCKQKSSYEYRSNNVWETWALQ